MSKSWAFLSFLLMSAAAGQAHAGIVNSGNVTIGANSYRTFIDQTTSLQWLDLDNFWEDGSTYNSLTALLDGSGFHLATFGDLVGLQASIPAIPANFLAEAMIVGGNYLGNPMPGVDRNLMWGIYEDGNSSNGISTSWKFDTSTGWNFGANTVSAITVFGTYSPSNRDLGAWVVSDVPVPAVPAPASLILWSVGGCLAFTGRRLQRRRKALTAA